MEDELSNPHSRMQAINQADPSAVENAAIRGQSLRSSTITNNLTQDQQFSSNFRFMARGTKPVLAQKKNIGGHQE